jgi:hypothetical protein
MRLTHLAVGLVALAGLTIAVRIQYPPPASALAAGT